VNKTDTDLVDRFVEGLSASQTRRAYQTDLRRFFGTSVDTECLQEVDATDIQASVRSMRDLGRSMGTQRRHLAALRSFFDWLISEGLHGQNPARHPDVQPLPVEVEPTDPNRLKRDDVAALLKAAAARAKTGTRDQALILTIVYGALRRSEVTGLQVEDVRPLGRHWVVDLDSTTTGGGYVRIPEALVELIERMKRELGISEGPLWRSRSNRSRGDALSPSAIYRIVRETGRRADINSLSIDTLRRTGLHLAIAGGATFSQVQAHGRYGDSSSVARLANPDEHRGGLSDSAVQYIDFDLEAAIEES